MTFQIGTNFQAELTGVRCSAATSQAGSCVSSTKGAHDFPVASDYQQVVKTCQPKEVPCLGQRACVECGRGTPSSVPCEGCPVLLISDAVDGKETGKAVSLWACGTPEQTHHLYRDHDGVAKVGWSSCITLSLVRK